jgi:predicted negative regulator of RcsB-dependent stress response
VDDLLSEKEQIDKMRQWWSEYGNYVISGVVLGAIILYGINYTQSTRLDAQYAASGLYDELTNHVVDGDVDEALLVIGQLSSDFPDSGYAAQSKLAMARLYMDENRDQDAADVLAQLLASNGSDEFKQVGRLRLAKILLYQNKAEDVLSMLDGIETGPFAARYSEAIGDAYVALERIPEAREAYQRALGEMGGGATIDQQFVQLKLLDLPVADISATSDAIENTEAEDSMDAVDAVESEESEESEESVESVESEEAATPEKAE